MTANDDGNDFLAITSQTQAERLGKFYRERRYDNGSRRLVSTPTGTEDSWSKDVFYGLDLAAGPDVGCDCLVAVHADGRIEFFSIETPEMPAGHITVDDEPMAFWLPAGVTAESIGVGTINSRGKE